MNKRADYFWNTVAGFINASETVFMSMIVTRTTGLDDAGILMIAFAVGNLLMMVGKYGIRNYQVTDTAPKYSFFEYYVFRIFSVMFMIICTTVYTCYSFFFLQTDDYKCVCISIICLIYAVESMEDVFMGGYQKEGFLAVGAKMFCARWCAILISFSIVIMCTKNMAIALLIAMIVSAFVFVIAVKISFKSIMGESLWGEKLNLLRQKSLISVGLPFFVASFLSFYVLNSPKYAIDACMDNSTLACFGFVAMPVFVIGLLNSFIYEPTLVAMADEWSGGLKVAFRKRIIKQNVIIIIVTVVGILGAYIVGIPILSWVYSTDLTEYRTELLVLLLAGGFLASSNYLGIVLTVMRRQKYLLSGYIIVAIIAFCSMRLVVSAYGTLGVSIEYCFLMVLLCVFYYFIVFRFWNRGQVMGEDVYDSIVNTKF